MKNYDIKQDYYFKIYVDNKDLSKPTERNYMQHLKKFCIAIGKPLEDIINECKAQQEIETEEIISSTNENGAQIIQKRIKKFDANNKDSLVYRYLNKFKDYCLEKNNKNTTINSGTDIIRVVLGYFGVKLPKWETLPNDIADWNLLSKDDFKFILADSSIMHKSLILFMLSSGLRLGDSLNITIGDYMKSTSKYHNFVEVDDFIDNAPDYMMGFFEFFPHKTKKRKTLCMTFNSPESNKFILQHLRKVKNDYLPRKSKELNEELKLSKSDYIFGSKHHLYKKPPLSDSISTMFGYKNNDFYNWHITQIKKDIEDGKISAEDYDEMVKLIPKFHSHACRKYFCTMIERHTSNERRYRLLEGHAPANKLDKSYINLARKQVAEVYQEAVGDLSIYYDDDKDLEGIREDFNQQLSAQKEHHKKEIELLNAEHKKEIDELRNKLQKTDESIIKLSNEIQESKVNIKTYKVRDVIISYLKNLGEFDNDRFQLLDLMVYQYAKDNPDEYEETEEFLFDLVKKLDIKVELSPKNISEQKLEIFKNGDFEDIDPAMIIFFDELLDIIKQNDSVMKRVGDIDLDRFDYLAEEYYNNHDVDIPNLTDDDKLGIATEILMKYLDYSK